MDAIDAAGALSGPGGDAELVAAMRAGRAAAFATLMRCNNQRLYRLARGVLRDDAEAEEAVQEGYLRAFTHLDGFRGESSLGTWLARIVLNEALARLRRRRSTVDIAAVAETLAADAPPLGRAEPTPEQALARQELRRAVEQAIDALPASFRAVFVMRALEQMSIEETAGFLGIPAETVKTRFHRANRLLRRSLSAEFGPIFEGAFPFLGARCDRLSAAVLRRLGFAGDADLSAAAARSRGADATPLTAFDRATH